jgi:hypothetical protein
VITSLTCHLLDWIIGRPADASPRSIGAQEDNYSGMLTATSRAFHALHRQVIGSCLYKNYTIVMEKMQGKMTKNKKISELFQYLNGRLSKHGTAQ